MPDDCRPQERLDADEGHQRGLEEPEPERERSARLTSATVVAAPVALATPATVAIRSVARS